MKNFVHVGAVLGYVFLSTLIFFWLLRQPSKSLGEGLSRALLIFVILEAAAGAYQLLPFSPRNVFKAYGVSCVMVALFVTTVLLIQNPVNQLIADIFDPDIFKNPGIIMLGGLACTSVAFFAIRGLIWCFHRAFAK